MIGAIVYQLTRNLSEEDIKKAGFDAFGGRSALRRVLDRQ